MDDFLPLELPPPRILAGMLMKRAWSSNVRDRDRVLHEQAARSLRKLLKRSLILAARCEQLEAQVAR